MKLFNRLKALVLAQGIISHIVILPEMDLVEDLDYQPADIIDLFRMVEREFKIRIAPEGYTKLTRLDHIADYIQGSTLVY